VIDPQFLLDFRRARPLPSDRRVAASWSINGQRVRRSVVDMLRTLEALPPARLLRITQLYNQRCGIDMTRRVQLLYGDGYMVLPESVTFTLDLQLHADEEGCILAAADMQVYSFDEETGLTGLEAVETVAVAATYHLDSGRVLYDIVTRLHSRGHPQ
jgi:hypothetical protein